MEKYKLLIASKSLPRAVKFEDTYLSSKAQLDSLLSDLKFLEISSAIVALDNNVQTESIYSGIYDDLNAHLSNVDPKFRVEVISSNGILKYSNKLTVEKAFEQPNQNTCPEVMASVNFVWGNPMINKTAFPITNIYPLELGPTIAEGYGLANRLSSTSGLFEYNVAKTNSDTVSPLNAKVFTVRVSVS